MQLYYHGRISRSAAESLVQIDGDYLVRESTNKSGQYVLTGRSSGTAQHLLLIDKNGRVSYTIITMMMMANNVVLGEV